MQFVLISDNEQTMGIITRGKVIRKAEYGVAVKFKNLSDYYRERIGQYAG